MTSVKDTLHLLMVHMLQTAMAQKTTTYFEIAPQVGLDHLSGKHLSVSITVLLNVLSEWYMQRGIPDLTCLVVRANGVGVGMPGPGFWNKKNLRSLGHVERQTLTKALHRQSWEFFSGFEDHDKLMGDTLAEITEKQEQRLIRFKAEVEQLALAFMRRWDRSMPDLEVRQRITYTVNSLNSQNKAYLVFPNQFALLVRDRATADALLPEIQRCERMNQHLAMGFCGYNILNEPFDVNRLLSCWRETLDEEGFLLSDMAAPNPVAIRNTGLALECSLSSRFVGASFYLHRHGVAIPRVKVTPHVHA